MAKKSKKKTIESIKFTQLMEEEQWYVVSSLSNECRCTFFLMLLIPTSVMHI